MQSTGIQPSQLLMEVLAGAQEKIGQGISKSGFSQQLYEQHQLVQNASFGQPATLTQQPNQASNAAAATKESSSEMSPEGYPGSSESNLMSSGGKVKGSLLSSAASRNLVTSKWKISQELTFTDPMALENVLAQFHLAPSVSAAIRNTLDDNGRISLQKLNQVLDRILSSQSELPPDGRAAADQIRSLLTGLLQQGQLPVQNYKVLEILNKGSYDFGEFRDLLRRLVEQIAKANVKQSGKSALQHPSELNSAADKPATEEASTSRAKLPNQTKSLAANLIPSFLREERDPLDKLKTSVLELATPPLSDSQSSKLPFLAAHKIDYREGFGSERKSGQLDGATARFQAPDSGSPAAWVSVMGGLPHVLLEALSSLSLATPLEASAGPDLEVASMEALAFSPTIRAGNPTVWAANSPLNSALISKESPLPLATSTPDNVFSAGERVIGALRPAPMEQDLNTESNLTARTLSAKTSIPVVEKIAAPARADFTYNQSDSSGNRDSISEYRSTASQQYPQRPAGILAETASANELPEFLVKHPKELVGEAAERPTPAAGSEPNERSAAPLSTKLQNPGGMFRNVISSQVTTPPGAASDTSTITQPAKVQNLEELFRDVTGLQMTTQPGDTGENSTVYESAKIQNPREILRDGAPLQMTTSPGDAVEKAATPQSATMQSPAEIPGDVNRSHKIAPPTNPGERSTVYESAKIQNPREILRDVAPLQMTTSPGDAVEKAATPQSVKMQTPAEISADVNRSHKMAPPTNPGESSTIPESAKIQNPRELLRDLAPLQMTTSPGDAVEKATIPQAVKMQSPAEISADVNRSQVMAPSTDPGESSTIPEAAKIQNPRELLRDVAPLQMTTSPGDAVEKAAIPQAVKMQTPAAISAEVNRSQVMAPSTNVDGRMAVLQNAKADQPDKSNQNIVFSRSQSRPEAKSSAGGPDSFPTQSIIEQSTSNQTPMAKPTVKDTSPDSSNQNPLRTIPAQNSPAPSAIKNAEDTAGSGSQKIAAPWPYTNEEPPKVAMDPIHVRRISPSDFRGPAQPLTTEQGSFATGFGTESIGSESTAVIAPSVLSDDQLIELAHLSEGYTKEQTQKSTLSANRSAQTRQDAETLSVPQRTVLENTKNFASPAETERAAPKPTRSNTPQDLIQPVSNRQDSNSRDSDPTKPPTVPRPGVSELKTNVPIPVSQEALPATPKPRFQNSIELLANSPEENEMTAGRSAPASQEVSEQATRSSSIESSNTEAPTHRNVEKAVTPTQSSDQSPRQEQGQEHTPAWFKDGVQMMPQPANPAADKAADLFSRYASSLASELAQRIQELYKQKRHELTLELEPKHLGRLLVRIGTDDNQVSTLIATDSEQIKELLSRSAPALRQELALQGLILEKLQIDVNSQATAQDQSFQQRNPGRRKNVSNQQLASSGKGLAEAGVRRIHIGNAETLLSLFV